MLTRLAPTAAPPASSDSLYKGMQLFSYQVSDKFWNRYVVSVILLIEHVLLLFLARSAELTGWPTTILKNVDAYLVCCVYYVFMVKKSCMFLLFI